MQKIWLGLAVSCSLYGGTITSVSSSNGTPYTVALGTDSITGNGMDGMSITATFNGGTLSATCIWADSNAGGATGLAGCVSLNNFSISYSGSANTHPFSNSSENWIITNLRSGNNLLSLSIDAFAGNTMFDRCAAEPDDSNPFSCLFGGDVTPNSNIGYTVASGNGNATNPTSATATAAYTNIAHLTAAAPLGDLYGKLTLSFSGTFSSTQTFTFQTDTDSVTSRSADVVANPEPSTFGLLGLGAIALGLARKKKN